MKKKYLGTFLKLPTDLKIAVNSRILSVVQPLVANALDLKKVCKLKRFKVRGSVNRSNPRNQLESKRKYSYKIKKSKQVQLSYLS